MKPSKIFTMLDLAKSIRAKGEIWNPLFSGEAGLGKSQICQAWVKKQQETNPNFQFVDLRLAVMDSQDMVGFPKVVNVNGFDRTKFMLPDFWPTEGEGLLLIEEPNRANPATMNALMQLLTDRKVHDYNLPDGWVIAGCINYGSGYDVNEMDTALSDRFEIFNIDYDHKTFVDFIKEKEWDASLVSFINSGIWVYKKAGELGDQGKYISPRTFSKLNNAEIGGASSDRDSHYEIALAELGNAVGREYHKFKFDETPVTANDLLTDKKTSLDKLKKYSSGDTYRSDILNVSIESVVESYGTENGVSMGLVLEVTQLLPADLGLKLIQQTLIKHNKDEKNKEIDFKVFMSEHPEVSDYLKRRIKKDATTSTKVLEETKVKKPKKTK